MNKKTKDIKVIATSLRGMRNASRNVPCQDHAHYSNSGKNFVAILSDGAGSTKYGKIGARIVCETLVDLLKNTKFENAKEQIFHAISVARQKIMRHRLNKNNMNDFAATLVGVIYYKNKGLFFHIGDGAAIAFDDTNYDNFIISRPENGHFSCETYFYTMENWKETLRFIAFENYNSFVLMSDGLTNFSFSNDFKSVEKNFLFPIHEFLSQEPKKNKALNALNKTLSNPKADKINPDDKTIIWARCL